MYYERSVITNIIFQAANFYVTRLGFEFAGYKGLETGERTYACHAVRQNDVSKIFWHCYRYIVH